MQEERLPFDLTPEQEKAFDKLAAALAVAGSYYQVPADPDNDPIAITHEQDPSLDEDEMIIHTMIESEPTPNKENDK